MTERDPRSPPSLLIAETVFEGIVERITFESPTSGFRVIKVAVEGRPDLLAVVGSFPPTAVGARIRVRGRIEQDRTHGPQLRADSLVELAPKTLAGLEKYLASGLVKGVGEKLAKRIVEAFGLDALRVLDETPERLREVEGLGEKRAAAVGRAWRDQRALRDVMVFLQSHGASAALAIRVVRRYGNRAIEKVSREPYRMALEVRGVGFKTADRIAKAIGVAPDSPERMQAGVLQILHDMTENGHVWSPKNEVVDRAAILLELGDAGDRDIRARLTRALDAMVLAGHAVVEGAGDEVAVYASDVHAAEVRLAQRLTQVAQGGASPIRGVEEAVRAFEASADVSLADEQRMAVEQAARQRLLVVTGGPGVGKTTILRAILSLLERAGIGVRLAAPTGRAAKRMAEATGTEASTIHRLLEFEPKTGAFKRNASHPLEAGAVIVDEASMLDLPMADALVQAVAPGTRLVLVGDVDQLPSVGPGAVLRDVISCGGVACVRLKHIFRQAARSLIVMNAHRINEGEVPVSGGPTPDTDFFIVDRRDPDRARETIVELVTSRIPHRFGLDPVRDVQVLTPMNRGPSGASALNEALQAALNPVGSELVRGARTYRVGDKIMQLRNDYDKNVYNGDVGVVLGIDSEEGSMTARFDDREVDFDAPDLDDVALAYACTIHKSQGSEYPAVVVPLLTTHFIMLTRNLLYTAVTRGKRLVVLVADPRALELALAHHRRDERRTHLADRLAAMLTGRRPVVTL